MLVRVAFVSLLSAFFLSHFALAEGATEAREYNLFCDFNDIGHLGVHFDGEVSQKNIKKVWFGNVDDKPYTDLTLQKIEGQVLEGDISLTYAASDTPNKTYEVKLTVQQKRQPVEAVQSSTYTSCRAIGYGQFKCEKYNSSGATESCRSIGYGQSRCEPIKATTKSDCHPIGYGLFKCGGDEDHTSRTQSVENTGHYYGELSIKRSDMEKSLYSGKVYCLLQ